MSLVSSPRQTPWYRSLAHVLIALMTVFAALTVAPKIANAQTVTLVNLFYKLNTYPSHKQIVLSVDSAGNVSATVSFILGDPGYIINWGSVTPVYGTYGRYGTGTPAVFPGVVGPQPTPYTNTPVAWSVNVSCVHRTAPQVVTAYSHTYAITSFAHTSASGYFEDGIPYVFTISENGNNLFASRFSACPNQQYQGLVDETVLNNSPGFYQTFQPKVTVNQVRSATSGLTYVEVTVSMNRRDYGWYISFGPAYSTGNGYTVNAVVQRNNTMYYTEQWGVEQCTYKLGWFRPGQYSFVLTQQLSPLSVNQGFTVY